MSPMSPEDFAQLYAAFQAPIAAFDCGAKCAPHNAYGVPFCCDPRHAVPTAYRAEWAYLQQHTDLWRLWQGEDPQETARLEAETPRHQVLLVCKGAAFCERAFRSLTCRAFPFFPYLTREGDFIGLAYYWQYEDRCWVLSNLHVVTAPFREQFVQAFEMVFARYPEERENFRYYSMVMRRVFGRKKREIPLLHREGGWYLVRPRDGRLRPVDPRRLPKHGVYALAAELPFPDEQEGMGAA